jgi:ABC-type glycerol-3-phosphate transport system substrate-binding protein
MTTLFTNYTGRAMTGEMTPQQAMDELQKELVALVDRSQDIMYPQS